MSLLSSTESCQGVSQAAVGGEQLVEEGGGVSGTQSRSQKVLSKHCKRCSSLAEA